MPATLFNAFSFGASRGEGLLYAHELLALEHMLVGLLIVIWFISVFISLFA
ncbi:MAG: hypothetical protein SFW07_06885 [Gammaproteobacteria bacterium]|nr:hypothetical protein [Gammaproteobacteria bacterium]